MNDHAAETTETRRLLAYIQHQLIDNCYVRSLLRERREIHNPEMTPTLLLLLSRSQRTSDWSGDRELHLISPNPARGPSAWPQLNCITVQPVSIAPTVQPVFINCSHRPIGVQ